MTEREGIGVGKSHGGQRAHHSSQNISILDVDRKGLTFANGCIGLKFQGKVADPTGDSEEAQALRTLLGLLRNSGVIG